MKAGAMVSKRIKKWGKKNISRILTNEKYVGDLIFKKFVTPNYLDHDIAVFIFLPLHLCC